MKSMFSQLPVRILRHERPSWKIPVTFVLAKRWKSVITTRTYDGAITLLNTLQTPHSILQARREAGIRIDSSDNDKLRVCLQKIGYTQSDLQKLNIIHISGTKGKGTTSSYVSSLLTHHSPPLKIGLFTSPHLLSVRERIRLNGLPLPAPLFTTYFFHIWDTLPSHLRPGYFRFLTLLSYHVFLSENVDAAVYEVGMGGEYDGTNIVERPAVSGVSSLGIDHVFTLGNTIEEIAWHKGGIFKAGVPAFSVPQPAGAMRVLEERAAERKVASFEVVDVDRRLDSVKVTPDAPFQRQNASLALALTDTVLLILDPSYTPSKTMLTPSLRAGIENMVFRGRFERIERAGVTWYLDGAHTKESICVAVGWFGGAVRNSKATRILVFNQQGDREAVELLEALYTNTQNERNLEFDHVIFCPTKTRSVQSAKKDFINNAHDATAITALTLQKQFVSKWREMAGEKPVIKVLANVDEAFEYIDTLAGTSEGEVQVFVTGSIHLVGTALSVLEGVDAL